jgi:SAM-dependent methyltransferase
MKSSHAFATPSPWITRWAGLIVPGGNVLDVACGSGRHSAWLSARGHPVVAVDRDPSILTWVAIAHGVTGVIADLEAGPWPLEGRRFDAVVVTNYLHRQLFPRLLDSLSPGGLLLYETFAIGNERFGRPSNRDFLLQPGELLERVRGRLRVVAYEDVEEGPPRPAMVQRIVARREGDHS